MDLLEVIKERIRKFNENRERNNIGTLKGLKEALAKGERHATEDRE